MGRKFPFRNGKDDFKRLAGVCKKRKKCEEEMAQGMTTLSLIREGIRLPFKTAILELRVQREEIRE